MLLSARLTPRLELFKVLPVKVSLAVVSTLSMMMCDEFFGRSGLLSLSSKHVRSAQSSVSGQPPSNVGGDAPWWLQYHFSLWPPVWQCKELLLLAVQLLGVDFLILAVVRVGLALSLFVDELLVGVHYVLRVHWILLVMMMVQVMMVVSLMLVVGVGQILTQLGLELVCLVHHLVRIVLVKFVNLGWPDVRGWLLGMLLRMLMLLGLLVRTDRGRDLLARLDR